MIGLTLLHIVLLHVGLLTFALSNSISGLAFVLSSAISGLLLHYMFLNLSFEFFWRSSIFV